MLRVFKLLGLGAALALLAIAAGNSGQIGLAQAGKTITVCASGCEFAKIQAAIDAAAGGDTIQVQAGTYQENLTIRNKDGLTLKGAGVDQVTLDGNAPAQQQNITPGILILNSRNITVTGFKVTNSRRGLEADDTALLFIETNTFDKNLRSGLTLLRSQAQLKGNIIQGTQVDIDASNGVGISLEGSQGTLSDNTITDNADCGVRAMLSGDQSSQANGGNNTIQNNKGGDLCGTAPTTLLARPPPEGTLDQVVVPTDAATIQEALNKVKAGGTITVAAGTYKEQVQIYKSVTIAGAGSDQTVIQAPSIEYVAINIATDPLQMTLEGFKVTGGRRGVNIATGPAGNATLRNMKIEANGTGRNPTNGDAGIWIYEQTTATLDQVSIVGNQGTGLQMGGQAKVTIQNSTAAENSYRAISLSDNVRATIEGNTISRNVAAGIRLGGSAQATISNNQITGAKPTGDVLGYGVIAVGDSRVTIEDNNTISQNAGFGIYLWDRTVSTIRRNTISDNNNAGVYLRGSARATIEDNTIRRNVRFGINVIETADAMISGNRITGNRPDANGWGGRGIQVAGNSRATIRDNTISENAQYGMDVAENGQATITNNTIMSNSSDGIRLGFTDIPDEKAQVEISNNTIQNNRNCGVSTDSDPNIKIIGHDNTISGNTKGQLCGTTSKFPAGFGGGK